MSNVERLFYIDSRITEHGWITTHDVEERFEISPRQIKRDFEYLRDRLGAPLEWVPSARHYVYAHAWDGLGFSSEKALLFYVFARAAAGTLAYVPVAEAGALENLRRFVPKDMCEIEHRIRYELPEFEPIDAERIGILMGAIRERRPVHAMYRDVEGKESERLLVPRRIVNYGGAWYTVAFDPDIRELRTFRMARFIRIGPCSKRLKLGPSETTVDRFIDSSYGMFKGQGDKIAVVRFRGQAREIMRHEQWHPDQVRREGTDAGDIEWLELEIPVSRWDEIVGRVLRYGAGAEAVSPPEFREQWLSAIDAMADWAKRCRHYTNDGDNGRHTGPVHSREYGPAKRRKVSRQQG